MQDSIKDPLEICGHKKQQDQAARMSVLFNNIQLLSYRDWECEELYLIRVGIFSGNLEK